MKLLINSDALLSKAIGDLRALYLQSRYVKMTLSTGRDRSLDQNSILHAWTTQISEELRENTQKGVKAEIKLRIGVPILRRDDEEFKAMYDEVMRPHSYETKLKIMDWMPVTSLMNVKQLSELLEETKRLYDGRVALEFPPDEV